MVDRDALLNLLDQIRIAIPAEIQRAAELEQERDRVLSLAESQAAETLAEAQARAEQLVEEHAIRAAAEKRAAQIIAQAQEQAATICDEAEAYALGELADLGRHLARLERVVANGVQHLQQRHQERCEAWEGEPVPPDGSDQSTAGG